MYGFESNQIGGYTQPNQQENYLEKVSRVWGPIFQRGARVLNTGINKISDPLMDRINEFQQSEAGQVANNLLEAATPGASLAFKGIDAAIDKFDLPQEAALLPLLGMLKTGRTPTKSQLKVLSKFNKPKQFGIGFRTLPITDRIVSPKEFLPKVGQHIRNKGYNFIQRNPQGNLKGQPVTTVAGQRFDNKINTPRSDGSLSLKVKNKKNRIQESIKRTSNEKPWIRQKEAIHEILTKAGHADKTNKFLKLIKNQYNAKVKLIKKDGYTKGHFKSLENNGLDVAENIGAEIGKSTSTQAGNYARGFRNDLSDKVLKEQGAFVGTLEDFVLMKLPEVLK